MKEIRLYDKMWFGKYKGLTMRDIFCKDKYYLDNLVKIGKIKFSNNIIKYLKDGEDKSSFRTYYSDPVTRYRSYSDTTSIDDFISIERPSISNENIDTPILNEISEQTAPPMDAWSDDFWLPVHNTTQT